jgi:hypothetical protein
VHASQHMRGMADLEATRSSSELEHGDESHLLEKPSLVDGEDDSREMRWQTSWRSHLTAVAVIAALLMTHVASFTLGRWTISQCSPMQSVAEPPKLAPVLRDLNIDTRHVKFDSTFFDQGSRYRAAPSPRTDAAWEQAGANCESSLWPFSTFVNY